MGPGYLIDSNTIIDFFNYSLPKQGIDLLLNIDPKISIITQIKIFSKNSISNTELSVLNGFIDTATIYEVNSNIAVKTIDLRLKQKTKLADAIIAATALCYNLILITRNVSDFKNVVGLEIVNPYSI
jgi:predicted nucleic acid-binding protein